VKLKTSDYYAHVVIAPRENLYIPRKKNGVIHSFPLSLTEINFSIFNFRFKFKENVNLYF